MKSVNIFSEQKMRYAVIVHFENTKFDQTNTLSYLLLPILDLKSSSPLPGLRSHLFSGVVCMVFFLCSSFIRFFSDRVAVRMLSIFEQQRLFLPRIASSWKTSHPWVHWIRIWYASNLNECIVYLGDRAFDWWHRINRRFDCDHVNFKSTKGIFQLFVSHRLPIDFSEVECDRCFLRQRNESIMRWDQKTKCCMWPVHSLQLAINLQTSVVIWLIQFLRSTRKHKWSLHM